MHTLVQDWQQRHMCAQIDDFAYLIDLQRIVFTYRLGELRLCAVSRGSNTLLMLHAW